MAATVKVAAMHARTVKALAKQYVDALVAYHVAENCEVITIQGMARTTARLYDAQNALNAAALEQALSY